MVDGDYFQRHLTAAWRLMVTGRSDALSHMDISPEGFWRSFLATIIALPALVMSWIASSPGYMTDGGLPQGTVIFRLALTDVAVWIVPIILLGAAAGRLQLGRRYAQYIIASNWGSALLAWLIVPPVLLGAFSGEPGSAGEAFLLLSAAISLTLGWRLAWAVFGRDATYATLIFGLVLALSIASNVAALQVLGLASQAS